MYIRVLKNMSISCPPPFLTIRKPLHMRSVRSCRDRIYTKIKDVQPRERNLDYSARAVHVLRCPRIQAIAATTKLIISNVCARADIARTLDIHTQFVHTASELICSHPQRIRGQYRPHHNRIKNLNACSNIKSPKKKLSGSAYICYNKNIFKMGPPYKAAHLNV